MPCSCSCALLLLLLLLLLLPRVPLPPPLLLPLLQVRPPHHHLEDGEVHVVLCLRRRPVLGMRRRVDDACGCVGVRVRVRHGRARRRVHASVRTGSSRVNDAHGHVDASSVLGRAVAPELCSGVPRGPVPRCAHGRWPLRAQSVCAPRAGLLKGACVRVRVRVRMRRAYLRHRSCRGRGCRTPARSGWAARCRQARVCRRRT